MGSKVYRRRKRIGWWEEYRCGCVSETALRKKDLSGYCPKHGDQARHVHPEHEPLLRHPENTMRATEMHDLLRDCQKAILQNNIWAPGTGSLSSIMYCRYCSYSQSHGHGDNCLIVRLERATSSEAEPKP